MNYPTYQQIKDLQKLENELEGILSNSMLTDQGFRREVEKKLEKTRQILAVYEGKPCRGTAPMINCPLDMGKIIKS